MAQFDLYIQIASQQAVVSREDLSIANLPPFVQGDSLDLRIFCLTPIIGGAAFVPVTGRTLEVALGPKPSLASYYTQQFTWTPSSDPGQPFFQSTLPMSTAAINLLFDKNVTAKAWFEVKLIESGVPRTVLSKAIKIAAAVILPEVLEVPANQTPLSAEVADATYLKRNITGIYYLINATDPTKKVAIWCAEDGSFHAEPVTQ